MKLRRSVLFVVVMSFLVIGSSLMALTSVQYAAAAGFDCASVTELPQAECAALVAFYQSTDGANWTDNSNWLVTNTPCQDWAGVICGEGYVEEIYLPANNLRGSLPAELSALSQMAFFDVSGNAVQGTVPASLGAIAELEEIYLHANKGLTGELPLELANLQRLTVLHVQDTGVCATPGIIQAASGTVNSAQVDAYHAWLANVEYVDSSGMACIPAGSDIEGYFPLILR